MNFTKIIVPVLALIIIGFVVYFSLNNKNKLQVVKEPTKKINTDSIKKVEELRKKQQEKSFDEMSKIF